MQHISFETTGSRQAIIKTLLRLAPEAALLSALQYKIRWWTRRLLLLRAFSLVPALWTVAASHIL